ncbi:MAG: lysylphosphatidylglycerol synthase transmembrane domain-containing protein [Anaerolineaceae bacterium]
MAKKRVIAGLLRWLIPLLISALVIWLVLRAIDFQTFVSNLGQIRWQTLFYASIVFFLSYFLRVFCWYILLRRKVPYWDAFFTMGVGYLLNNILPFRLGEIARAVMLDQSGRISPLEVFSSVIVERIFDVFLAAIFILSVIPRILSSSFDLRLIFVVFLLAMMGLIGLFLVAKYRDRVSAWFSRRGERSRFIRDWLAPKIAHALEGFAVLTDLKPFTIAFGSLVLSWWLAFGQSMIIFKNLYLNPPFWWMIFVLSAGAFAAALPSAPAGLGVYEGAVVAAFAVLGVDMETALTYAILTHAMSILFTTLIGLVGLKMRDEALIAFVQRVLERSPRDQEIGSA